MTIALRRLSRQEADDAWDQVRQPASDLILEMALRIIRQRNALRTRTLVAHLRSWEQDPTTGREDRFTDTSDVQPFTAEQVDEMAMARALALLAIEAEQHRGSQAEQAAWTRRRLAELLAESQQSTREAQDILMRKTA